MLRISGARAVLVEDLRKSYGGHDALRGISFEIREGEVFSLLGPNGAGKTTTIEILEGYRRRDGGTVSVLGADPARTTREWRARIGVVLQSSAMYETLTVRESLALFGGYYEQPRPVDEVIGVVGLEENADRVVRKLSGGQRRRLDFGLALVGDPELIFLDEPTTGFDPAARRDGVGDDPLSTRARQDDPADDALPRRGGAALGPRRRPARRTHRRHRHAGRPHAHARDGDPLPRERSRRRAPHRGADARARGADVARAVERGEELADLSVRRPSLEEVYLELTE